MGPSSLLQIISRTKQAFCTQETLHATDIPLLYREPGVESGYRPTGKSWLYYVISIFQWNNETVNVWTHLIASIIFLLKFFLLSYTVDGHPNAWPFVAFGLSTIAYASMSTFAHTFHSKSPYLHYMCFQLDYFGIGLYSIGTNILILHTGSPNWFHEILQGYTVIVFPILAWSYLIGCCIAKLKYKRPYPPQRKIMQLFSGSVSILPSLIIMLYRIGTCLTDDACVMTSLSHHARWMSPFIACVFFFSSHLPEKLYPGKFDFVGQGHQLFHVFVTMASILQHDAGHIDLLDESLSHAKLFNKTIWDALVIFAIYIAGSLVVIFNLRSTVDRRVDSDLKSN